MLAPGRIVLIYQDPITQQHAEGTAMLLRRLWVNEDDGLERWIVRFGNDGKYERTIRTDADSE